MAPLSQDPSNDQTAQTYSDPNGTYPTPEQLKKITQMASFGARPTAIAKMFDIPEEILLAYCGKEIAAAALESQELVLSALLNMAKSEKNISATTFWLKTFAAHLLPTPPVKDDSPKSSDRPPVDFFVYNNDGEPNADY
jgi:hypothetical protein